MRKPNSKPRSAQRQAVLALFEKQSVITKYDVAPVIGLTNTSAANLLSAMHKDGILSTGEQLQGTKRHPLRTFTRSQTHTGFNPRLTMALRRRTNEQLGIESANAR